MSNKPDPALLAKLQQLSPQQREALLKKLQSQKSTQNISTPEKIMAVARDKNNFPLSPAQQRLWFLEQLSDSHASYNIAAAFSLHGSLDTAIFTTAINLIINKYESLRTYFPSDDNGVTQQVYLSLDWKLTINVCEKEAVAEKIHQAANMRFNLATGPLFCIELLRISDDYHILIVVLHHIISDAWSTTLLLNDVSQFYNSLHNGKAAANTTLTLQYIDYTVWQEKFLQSEQAKAQIHYWQSSLADSHNLDFPIDKKRPSLSSYNGAIHRSHFSQTQKETLQLWCKNNNVTLFCALLSTYEILLYRYTQQNNFCVGIPVANRHHSETENIMGFFVNSLAMRCDIQTGHHFLDTCKAVQKRLLDAHSHQDIPFEQLLTQLHHIERNPAINPVFQTFFTLTQDNIQHGLQLNQLSCEYLPADIDGTKFDYSLSLREHADGIECHFEYNKDLFFTDTITALAEHYITLTLSLINNDRLPIENIQYIRPSDYALQMDLNHGWNATTQHHSPCAALQILFEQTCEKNPLLIAVADEHTSLSYQSLNERANQLAHYLRKQHISANQPIAVFLDRSVNISITLLAILKAGGAYVPLTTDLPTARIEHICKETNATLIICDSNKLPSNLLTAPLLYIDQPLWQEEPRYNPICLNKPDDIMNIIYTSGSTGNPKGVMVPHQGIINRLIWMQNQYVLLPNDIVLQKTPYNFDVSVWELFWPLIAGASLFFAKPEGHKDNDYLIDVINQRKISHLHFVPSMLGLFLQHEKVAACHSIKKVFTSGEALQIEHNNTFFETFDTAELHNLYGPTEASIDVSHYACMPNAITSIPIGKPIDNTQLYILDKHLHPLPIGAVGELYIGGIGLALGYYQQETLTTKVFITNPYANNNHANKRLYKTGDVARYLPDGNIEYLGRNDNQVKIRGFRIELMEIEHQLRKMTGIKDVAVISKQYTNNTIIVAYIVSDEILQDKNILNEHLKHILPEYMLPNLYISIQALPLSSNGKLDKKQLPDIDFSSRVKKYIPPTSTIEITLASIWQELLQITEISKDDNFFDLGGHSILAAQMLIRIRSQFAIELPLKTLFELNTIEALAKIITAMLPNDNSENESDEYEEGTL